MLPPRDGNGGCWSCLSRRAHWGRESKLLAVLHSAKRWWGAIALVAVVAMAAGIGQTSAGHAILRRAGILEEPASYTSLAFLHPQSLPEQLVSKRASIEFAFVIHNAGGTPRDYRWSVLLVHGKRARPVGSGSIRVAPGRGAAITRSANVSCTRGRVRIVVSLARPAESIDAWTACWSPGN
jgi:hypothetical protein